MWSMHWPAVGPVDNRSPIMSELWAGGSWGNGFCGHRQPSGTSHHQPSPLPLPLPLPPPPPSARPGPARPGSDQQQWCLLWGVSWLNRVTRLATSPEAKRRSRPLVTSAKPGSSCEGGDGMRSKGREELSGWGRGWGRGRGRGGITAERDVTLQG